MAMPATCNVHRQAAATRSAVHENGSPGRSTANRKERLHFGEPLRGLHVALAVELQQA
jgi:hypothetical protein